MVSLAALLLATATLPPASPVAPERQARVMVRIVTSAQLRFSDLEKSDPSLFRTSIVRSASGDSETAKLIEFQ